MKNLILPALLCLFSCTAFANTESDSTTVSSEYTEAEFQAAYRAFIDSIENTLNYETGTIAIGEGIATLEVPDGYKYLNGSSSDMILTDIWGNPPSEPEDQSLGMLIPAGNSVLDDSTFVINITYSEEGYIDDADAQDIDYAELLETMQTDMEEVNPKRVEAGYPTLDLIGWASPPYYDAANKKLHWAKELRFGGEAEHTLNYNIRVLGRKGYLELNVIGGMYVLDEVKRKINPLLASVNFDTGYQYSDFDPNLDKVAAYGLGGLIAGKVLAKAGILAKLGVLLAKFWKIIAVGLVGAFAGIRRLFGKKEEESPSVEGEA